MNSSIDYFVRMNENVIGAIVAGIVTIAGLIFRSRTVKKRKRNKEKEVTTSFINNKKKEASNV